MASSVSTIDLSYSRSGIFRSITSWKIFSMSMEDIRSLPFRREQTVGSWNSNGGPMVHRELTTSQQEFFDSCKRGDLLKVASYINAKKNRRTRTGPLHLFRPATPLVGWVAAIREGHSLHTPLHAASTGGFSAIAALLLEADPQQATTRDRKECFPLHLASYGGHAEIVQILVKSAPETIDCVNCALETPLHLAAQHGHSAIVRILLVGHANGYLRNARNETALDIAARTGHHTVCQYLVSYCPELPLHCATDSSQTSEHSRRNPCVYPIHAAARYSNVSCLRVLREAGFDVDFVGKEGSAMHVACMFGQPESVMFFIESGINPELRDSDGKTALELLDDLIQRKDSDITQIIQSREGWEECRSLLLHYIDRWEKTNINSSSDSGIDGREYRRQEDIDRDAIWQPLPHNSNTRSMQMGTYRTTSDASSGISSDALSTLPRNWSRNTPIPLTCPYYAQKHRSVHRVSNTLPLNMSPQRTNETPKRETILSTANVFSPPGIPALTCRRIEKDGSSITYNPGCAYDNIIKDPSHFSFDNSTKFNYKAASLGGSVGRSHGRPNFIRDGTQTLPTPRQRPSLKSTFSPIAEVQNEERKIQHEASPLFYSERESTSESVGISNSPYFTNKNADNNSAMFNFSTLERSASPSVADPAPAGRAPLAQPEEMTGSTTASIMSNSTPEREFRSQSANGTSSLFTTSVTIQASDPGHYMGSDSLSLDTVNVSISSLSLDGHNNPPSPNTSQRQIFEALAHLNSENRTGIISPSITELSDSTVASSCSLPVISQISNSPQSPLSPKKRNNSKKPPESESHSSEVRLRSGVSSQNSNSDYQINEQEEWSQIEGIMSSFGSGICRESVFTTDYENKVSRYLRDKNEQAVTLTKTLPTSDGKECLSKDEEAMISWLHACVGLSRSMAEQIGEILVVNGFDKTSQLHGSVTAEWMNYLNIDRQSQTRILAYLGTIEDSRPKAEDLEYLSDWLCSLELISYMGKFVEAELRSPHAVKAAKLSFDDYKTKLGINLIGHITRIIQSFEPEYPLVRVKTKRQNSDQSALRRSATYTPIQLKLLNDSINFSAHYLGAVVVRNINGTEESRIVMGKMKKEIRDLSRIKQVTLEINIAGITVNQIHPKNKLFYNSLQSVQIVCQDQKDLNCFSIITTNDEYYDCHVFSVLTADVANEVIGVLKEAFDLAYGMATNQEAIDDSHYP